MGIWIMMHAMLLYVYTCVLDLTIIINDLDCGCVVYKLCQGCTTGNGASESKGLSLFNTVVIDDGN